MCCPGLGAFASYLGTLANAHGQQRGLAHGWIEIPVYVARARHVDVAWVANTENVTALARAPKGLLKTKNNLCEQRNKMRRLRVTRMDQSPKTLLVTLLMRPKPSEWIAVIFVSESAGENKGGR